MSTHSRLDIRNETSGHHGQTTLPDSAGRNRSGAIQYYMSKKTPTEEAQAVNRLQLANLTFISPEIGPVSRVQIPRYELRTPKPTQ